MNSTIRGKYTAATGVDGVEKTCKQLQAAGSLPEQKHHSQHYHSSTAPYFSLTSAEIAISVLSVCLSTASTWPLSGSSISHLHNKQHTSTNSGARWQQRGLSQWARVDGGGVAEG